VLFPLPWWPPARRAYASERRGLRGGGCNYLKCCLIDPHPNCSAKLAACPLPSREREFFDFLRSHQYFADR